tara:strand:+ start:1161 stop:3350 length:2190 start_codon:yes stop_codon:yes gene_type:complete
MTISIWRYSHLSLAISSALFIVIASITGIILAFEPISNKLKPYNISNLETISIAETVSVLQDKYDEIITLEVDENNFITTSVILKDGKSDTFYIDPTTGEKIGKSISRKKIYEFATNLHRSLFLKSTGRFIVGFVSFLLLLISISGVYLIVIRQGGFSKVFSKIIKENIHQYYHIVVGRYMLIPIIIITLTGIYLSLEKFSFLPQVNNSHQILNADKTAPSIHPIDFKFFKSTKLQDIEKIEFPFSSDEDDYFFVKTIDNEFAIHQFNGEIISQKKESLVALGSHYSFLLHTGHGSIIWSIILLLASVAILFFIYSGFSMTLKRRKESSSIKNKTLKDVAEYILLVGSETGSTIRFASVFKNALIKANKSVFASELNSYDTYENAKNIIIFTATYGEGDAPANAQKFIQRMNTIEPINKLNYSVIGFGSKAYPEFCKYAIEVNENLQNHHKFSPTIPLFKINNQEINSFNKWVAKWSHFNKIELETNFNENLKPNKQVFTVINKTAMNNDNTFIIQLKPDKKIKFTSGDLLSITPKNETKSRLYSIGKINDTILLSIRKHEAGVCSTYFHDLRIADKIKGSIQENKKFNFPKKSKEVILIANGTGIAPFLGMIQENKNVKVHLFWGGRNKKSFEIYKKMIVLALKNKTLTSLNIAYSREQKENKYVQNLLKNHTKLVSNILQNENHILICGSLKMQKGVEDIIDLIAKQKLNSNIKTLKENNLIKADCY